MSKDKKEKEFPPQHQEKQPGLEYKMRPQPVYIRDNYQGSNKLKDKVAIVTGGDSGIGRAVCIHFAREGANLVINYLNEDKDAEDTLKEVMAEGVKGILVKGDLGDPELSKEIVDRAIEEFDRIDVLVNNAAEQHEAEKLTEISDEQIRKTFETNIFAMFYLTKAVLPHLEKGSAIINTTSVTAYRGSDHLMDYAATKGAILSFTRSLAANLASKDIRVNAVAPGPIWTPLIVSSFDAEEVSKFGQDQPMGRAGQPSEVAPAYVFLACEDSSYITGQVLHPNGGGIVGG